MTALPDSESAGLRQRVSGRIRSLGSYPSSARRPTKLVAVGLVVIFAYFLPVLQLPVLDTPDSDFASVLFYPVGIYVLMALGLNIVVGFTGLLDLGYVAFFAVGAYSTAILTSNLGWSYYEALPVAGLLAAAAGFLLGLPVLRLRGDYLAIVTLGFGEIARITANNLSVLGGTQGVSSIPHPPQTLGLTFGILNSVPYDWLILTLIIIVYWVGNRLQNSQIGRYWAAIREDHSTASMMGVPVTRYKLYAFTLGGAIGGLGGATFASKVSSIVPDNFTLTLSVFFLAAIVLGGRGHMPGVVLGAVLLGYLPERFRVLGDYRTLFFGVVLLTIVLLRPQGLWPRRFSKRTAPPSDPVPHAEVRSGAA